ncbi:hypothetical protein [Aromatoleum petrolei]|uniref:Uncharacterized protein n=1 Tax=Aromatoleum petrolei TaxID=76116 RepID=A0ABX1MKS0_9RHOO|nr:hypothetical protein [Aromatoleum petrolei]NMF87801.1 hypothetical protein [Aromatoleum petrolei]QTQ35333.1 Uncharacterized protein ToN1_11640 [Aromatoleum petrolei]
MLQRALLASFILLLSTTLSAQTATAQADVSPAPAVATDAAKPDRSFRDISGYRYPALSRTQGDLQSLAYALQLRDYCADERVPDDFVKAQLASFSRITGRTETCRTLLAY